MQYAVPQFTDIEDKIVAGLGFKQFGILFLAGIIIFVAYTITKSTLVTIFVGIIAGIPGIAVAFGRINGRPIYVGFSSLVKFIAQPKDFIFHKQGKTAADKNAAEVIVAENKNFAEARKTARVRIKQLNYLLQQQASEEAVLIERLNDPALNPPDR